MKNIENKSGVLIGGGIVASLIASLCCVGPLILTILGVSGAAALAQLEVLRIPMTIIVIAVFGYTGYLLKKKSISCEPGSICADPRKFKIMVIFYFVGLALALISLSSPYWVVWIFG
jgi:mercuric ion transport protein